MFSILPQSLKSRRSTHLARFAITLLIALSFLLSLPRQISIASNSTSPTSADKSSDKKVKTFKGAAVKRHVEKERLKNKGLERAIREYAKKGLSPRWEESVILQQVAESSAVDKPQGLFQRVSYPAPQETYTEGDTSITFITYGGDLNYWDGVVLIQTPYQSDTYSGDFLTPTDDGTNWDVVNEVYYPPDGGTPCDGTRACMVEGPVAEASPAQKQKAEGKAMLAHGKAKAVKPGLWGWLKNWWTCTRIGCSIGYAYCPGGNYRFLCRVAICVYSAFACL
jgi:hypothetical protein